jgi:hypothetical protein
MSTFNFFCMFLNNNSDNSFRYVALLGQGFMIHTFTGIKYDYVTLISPLAPNFKTKIN